MGAMICSLLTKISGTSYINDDLCHGETASSNTDINDLNVVYRPWYCGWCSYTSQLSFRRRQVTDIRPCTDSTVRLHR